MRLVTIDNGNTNPNVGIFDEGVLQSVVPLKDYSPASGDYILISSVGRALTVKPSFDLKTKRTKTHFFEMPINYSETLGDDRMIAAYGVFKKITKNERVLIVDAGTFITCDLVSMAGFEGGYILPGINRFLKIYADSAQLPLLKQEELFKTNTDLPHTTEEAILKGTEIYLKGVLKEAIAKTSPDRIILTGGSALEIKNLISSEVPIEMDRHLIHSALSLIHQTHLRQE